jgi:hypothetical protein
MGVEVGVGLVGGGKVGVRDGGEVCDRRGIPVSVEGSVFFLERFMLDTEKLERR